MTVNELSGLRNRMFDISLYQKEKTGTTTLSFLPLPPQFIKITPY